MSNSAKVRISYAILIRLVWSLHHETRYLTLLNLNSLMKGARVFKALGGSGLLTPMGKACLIHKYGAINFEGECDARFQVDETCVEAIMDFFATQDENLFEVSPRREMCEELLELELPEQTSPILTPSDFATIETNFVRIARLPPGELFKSGRAGDLPTYRVFSLHDAYVPDAVFEKFESSKVCRLVTALDIERGVTPDGFQIGGNVMR